jgi:hypothetical protein
LLLPRGEKRQFQDEVRLWLAIHITKMSGLSLLSVDGIVGGFPRMVWASARFMVLSGRRRRSD